MVSMITTGWRAGLPARLEGGPQLAGEAAPGQEADQVGGALGVPGRQNQGKGRVGAQKFLKGVRHQVLFPRMGGSRQPYRPAGLPRFSFSRGPAVQEAAKFLEASFVPALEQAVVLQVAGEMQPGGSNSQALKPLKIGERPCSDHIIKIKYTG